MSEEKKKINIGEWNKAHEQMQESIGDHMVEAMKTDPTKSDSYKQFKKEHPDMFKEKKDE